MITTGIKLLDNKLNGGLPERTVVLLSGGPGSGKTLFGLNYLNEGLKKGEKGVYISLNENKEELIRASEGIKGLKDMKKQLGKKLSIESIELGKMIDLTYFIDIFSSYPKVDRLVVDNVNKMLMFADDKKEFRKQLSKLIKILKKKTKSAILLCETVDHELDTGNGEAYECDGVINIRFIEVEEKPKRMIAVYKMRYTDFEERVQYELKLNSKGFKMTETRII